ncbi:hypothetical protein [Erythrobacter sp.]|uniref:hypothetical protein n=1 Tax=Erythrobacter sp. TaxID=1042 RepID=UPI002EAFE856|nr:hypothetical protein [Erythrobacter sp.]
MIAFLALLGGIAALQAPAQASSLDSFVFDARAFARSNDTQASKQCSCQSQEQKASRRCAKRERPAVSRRLLETLGLPALFESDRALE